MDITKYLEIPYVWDGRSFEGADCYGLIVLYFREELGIELWDPLELHLPHWKDAERTNVLSLNTEREWVKVKEARLHDVVLIRLGESKTPNHCGVVISSSQFLHIQGKPGVSTPKLSLWKPRIAGYYRHRSLCP
jgi:cell wall-associated NlpC family hydrolase